VQPSVYPVLPFEQLASRIDASGDCWEWTGSRTPKGYGQVLVKIDGKWHNRRAHRLVWVALCGPIPGNLSLDHLCRNRGCVNPDHLEPVTERLNKLRGFGLPAMRARQLHCIRGHANWTVKKSGSRQCLDCASLYTSPAWESNTNLPYCKRGHERKKESLTSQRACRVCKNARERDRKRRLRGIYPRES
jgi:hypothetical protein